MIDRFWDGKTSHVSLTNPTHDRRTVDIALTPETARELSIALRRLEQTSLMSADGVRELADALDYVLVGDPSSRAKHRVMEAGKGMAGSDEDFRCPRCGERSDAAGAVSCRHAFHGSHGGLGNG
jgi:hypothetical protein